LLGRTAGQVVLQDNGYFLSHLFTFSLSMVLHRSVTVPGDRE
jgi:hypothetical protein